VYRYLLVLAFTTVASAATLTFEGLADGTPIADTYSDLGVVFTGGLALVDTDQGGSADMGGEPSPSTALYSEGTLLMNVTVGMFGITLYYSNPFGTTTIREYAELDGHGEILSEANLPSTATNGAPDPTGSFSPFVFASMRTNENVQSLLIMSRAANGFFIDDLTLLELGAEIPEPATTLLLSTAGIAHLWTMWRRERRQVP
jgi:hypothetical protein